MHVRTCNACSLLPRLDSSWKHLMQLNIDLEFLIFQLALFRTSNYLLITQSLLNWAWCFFHHLKPITSLNLKSTSLVEIIKLSVAILCSLQQHPYYKISAYLPPPNQPLNSVTITHYCYSFSNLIYSLHFRIFLSSSKLIEMHHQEVTKHLYKI